MRIDSTIIIKALKLLMRPIVKFCIKHSLRIQDFTEVGKSLFVELAIEESKNQNEDINKSKISIMTGLHRRDVIRLVSSTEPVDKSNDIISKIIGQWQSDKRFSDKNSHPKILSYGFEKSDFTKLVKLTSNDISALTVLNEMIRIKTVEIVEDGIKLLLGSYIPKGNPIHGFKILSDDMEDLKNAVEDNIFANKKTPNMHFRTVYDRIDSDALDEINIWLLEQGKELHLKARQFLSKYDLDINPNNSNEKKAKRVVLSSFSLIENDDIDKSS